MKHLPLIAIQILFYSVFSCAMQSAHVSNVQGYCSDDDLFIESFFAVDKEVLVVADRIDRRQLENVVRNITKKTYTPRVKPVVKKRKRIRDSFYFEQKEFIEKTPGEISDELNKLIVSRDFEKTFELLAQQERYSSYSPLGLKLLDVLFKKINTVEEFCNNLTVFPVYTGAMAKTVAFFGHNKEFYHDYRRIRSLAYKSHVLPITRALVRNRNYEKAEIKDTRNVCNFVQLVPKEKKQMENVSKAIKKPIGMTLENLSRKLDKYIMCQEDFEKTYNLLITNALVNIHCLLGLKLIEVLLKNITTVEEFSKDLIAFPYGTGLMAKRFAAFGNNNEFVQSYNYIKTLACTSHNFLPVVVCLVNDDTYALIK